MSVGENIKRFRKERGNTLEEVARASGTTKQTVGRYESGEISNIPYDKIVAIANFLRVSPGDLMGWNEPLAPDVVDTDILVELGSNADFMKRMKLFMELSDSSKQTILEHIDFLFAKEKGTN